MLRSRFLPAMLVCCLAATWSLARDRDAARQAYQRAVDYHGWLKQQPEGEKTRKRYSRAIFLYRTVIDNDPSYGACDDSIFAMAELYDELFQRDSRERDRGQAVYYYDFVVREYPLTRHKAEAARRAHQLQNVADSRAAPPSRGGSPGETGATNTLAVLSEVRHWSTEDYTRVVLQLDREVEFERSVLSAPDRIYFDLLGTRAKEGAVAEKYEVNGLFLKQLRVAQNQPDRVRVVLDFEQLNKHTVFALYNPFRIVIDTRGVPRRAESLGPKGEDSPTGTGLPGVSLNSSAPEAGTIGSPDSARSTSGDLTLTRTLGLKVGKVVIDPGHGGKDTGTIGRGGLQEKDLVLAVSLRLRELLEKNLGIEVVMTREDDRFVPLEERTAIGNQAGADLFISVHANSSRNRAASGIETFVLDFASDQNAQDVASRENASSQRTIRELEDLLRQIALGDYNQESRNLARSIQTTLFDSLRPHLPNHKDRGVKQAPFIVLIGSNMPSVLTEIGFISNPSDEGFLKTGEARESVAQGLFLGVESYFRSLGVTVDAQRAAAISSP